MAAASYYNPDQFEPRPFIGPQNAYGNGPHSAPITSTVPPSQLYTGSAYHGPNKHPSQPVEPLLNKPPASQPLLNKPPASQPLLDKPPTSQRPSAANRSPQKLDMVDPSSNRLRQRKYQKWKRLLRILQLATKSITLLFSFIMFGIMVFIVIEYQTTKDTLRGGRNAWPKDPKVWPTIMLLLASFITLMLSFITLLMYCCNFNRARRSWKLVVAKYAIHIGAWTTVSVIYRYEKSLHGVNNDLWGWTCSNEAALLQNEFNGVIDFSRLCNSQVRTIQRLSRMNPVNIDSYPTVKLLGYLACGIHRKDCICNWTFHNIQKNQRRRKGAPCRWIGGCDHR